MYNTSPGKHGGPRRGGGNRHGRDVHGRAHVGKGAKTVQLYILFPIIHFCFKLYILFFMVPEPVDGADVEQQNVVSATARGQGLVGHEETKFIMKNKMYNNKHNV